MLGWFTTSRFASHHSPLRESRELFEKMRRADGTMGSVEDTLETTRNQEVQQIIDQTRARLDRVMGDLLHIDHQIAQSPILSMQELLDERKREIETLLQQDREMDVATAQHRVSQLEQLAADSKKSEQELLSDKAPERNAAAEYDISNDTIALQENLTGEQKVDLLRHETGHRLVHLLEKHDLISDQHFREKYESLKDQPVALGDGTQSTFATVFAELLKTNRQYGIYKDDRGEIDPGVAMEELAVRWSDWKARGENPKDFDQRELLLFAMIGDAEKKVSMARPGKQEDKRGTKRFAKTGSAEGPGDAEESEKKPLSPDDMLIKGQNVKAKMQEIKDLYLSVQALSKDSELNAQATEGIAYLERDLPSIRFMIEVAQDGIDGKKNLTPEVLKMIDDQLGKYESILDKTRESINDSLKELHSDQLQQTKTKRLGNWFGMDFYSLKEIGVVVGKVVKAYSDAFENWQKRRENELVRKVATLVPKWPLGDTVHNDLISGSDSELIKPDETELNYLKENRIQFSALFADGGRMDKTRDRNKRIAILKYAAERGWLYDIRKTDGKDRKILFGKYDLYDLIPQDWDPARKNEFYVTLAAENTSGVDHEIDHEYKAVHSVDKAHIFVEKFYQELHHYNFWGAIGIAKRALERGLASEIGPWLSATLIGFLDHDPMARKFAQNREIFDKMGLLTFQNSFGTMSYFKWDRDPWLAYAENPKMNLASAGILGRTYSLAKEEIEHTAGKHLESGELNKLIAKMMAGKIITVNGVNLSIFSNRYAPFNKGPGKQSKIDGIPDEDPDYYTDIADNIHADETVIKAIFNITGSGFFQLKEKVGYFAERLIEVYHFHNDAKLQNEAETYRRTIKNKLNRWLEPTMRDTRSQSVIGERFGPASKFPGESIVVQLVLEGLVDFKLLQDAYENKMQAHPGFVNAFFKELFKDKDVVQIRGYGPVKKANYLTAFAPPKP